MSAVSALSARQRKAGGGRSRGVRTQIQNSLGLALSEKGLRGPAEAALRRAVQIDPGCADAHNNLAVAYITQQPPLVELARWHYQKALAAGHPNNPELEKMLNAAKPAGSGQ